jgi:hypothetical protein
LSRRNLLIIFKKITSKKSFNFRQKLKIIEKCGNNPNFFCDVLKNSKNNVGFVIHENKFVMFSKLCGDLALTAMNVEENRMLFTFTTQTYSFFNKDISDFLDKMVPSGIFQYYMDQHDKDFEGTITKIDEKHAKVLKLEDFKFLIILLMFLYGLSIIVFILEYSKAAAKEIVIIILRYCYSRC